MAQSGTLGSIMLSGLACGKYKSIEEAAKVFVKEKKIYYPNCDNHVKYMAIYKKYERLYDAVKAVMK